MTDQETDGSPPVPSPPVSPGPALMAALVSGLWYIAITLYVYKKDIILSEAQIIGMHIGFISLSVILSHYLLYRSTKVDLGIKRTFIYGWMSALLLGLITGIFYKVFFAQTGEQPNIPNYFARMLITYNFFGLVISAIVALFTSALSGKKD